VYKVYKECEWEWEEYRKALKQRTILPEPKMRAVLLGSRILIITAAKRFGLYSAFLACSAIFFRSRGHSKFTVATTFYTENQETDGIRRLVN
jgi:hypothetical protein